jgi:hypothetical protein
MRDKGPFPWRNEIHRATIQQFGPMNYGFITRPMGHFIEQEPGGTGIKWKEGAPVEWYMDPDRGEYPQVILPDGHIFTCDENDVTVTTHSRYLLRMSNIHQYMDRKAV